MYEITRELGEMAGELRKKFRLALPDIYVLAAGLKNGAAPSF